MWVFGAAESERGDEETDFELEASGHGEKGGGWPANCSVSLCINNCDKRQWPAGS